MRTLEQHLSSYAAYHRDRRNIATHFVGIPMIVLAVFALLARPSVGVGTAALSPARVVLALGSLFYFRLDLRFGLAMLACNVPAYCFGVWLAGQSFTYWLGGGVGLFVLGWVIQFVGHAFEGRKPAFVDDLVGLIVGPLFLVAEAVFFFGLRRELAATVEASAGPTRSGRGDVKLRATA